MAENEFVEDLQDRLSNLIWSTLFWALIAALGWGGKTALQVNELASLTRESASEVRSLKNEVESLSIRLAIIETKLESSSVNK